MTLLAATKALRERRFGGAAGFPTKGTSGMTVWGGSWIPDKSAFGNDALAGCHGLTEMEDT